MRILCNNHYFCVRQKSACAYFLEGVRVEKDKMQEADRMILLQQS